MRYLLPFFILLLFSCQSPIDNIGSPITDQEKQMAKDLILGAFDDLWGGIDSTKISKYHTEDFYILEHGEYWDNDRVREFMRKEHKRENRPNRTNRMEFISIDKVGSSLSMAYRNYAEFYQGDSLVGRSQWLESALVIPTKEGWKIKNMHSTWFPRKE